MKQVFITLSVLLFTTAIKAQKTSIGLHAGATLASYKIKAMGVSVTSDSKVGFTGGLVLDVPVGEMFSFQPALNFAQKGGILEADNGSANAKITSTLNYIEVPLNFLYTPKTKDGKFLLGAGPALGIGLSGKDKSEANGVSEKTDSNFGSKEDELKRFDLGLNLLAGYQFNQGFVVTLNYTPGLLNLSNINEATYRNRFFGLTVGYFFKSQAKK